MRKIFTKVMAVAASAMLALTPVSVMADSYNIGDDTDIVFQFYAQNGGDVENDWYWMDDMDDEVKLIYQIPSHYFMNMHSERFENADGPIHTIGFQIGYYSLRPSQTLECAVSFENVVAHFDGYDDVIIPNFSALEGSNMKYGKVKIELLDVFTEEMPVADMLKHIKSIEFDANVIVFSVKDEDGSEVFIEHTTEEEPTEEGETVDETETVIDGETEEPTLEVEDPTTEEAPTEKPTKAPKETKEEKTTIAETEAETEPSIEATTTVAQKDDKDDKDSGKTAKIVISIIFVVILLGALGVIGFNFMKKK